MKNSFVFSLLLAFASALAQTSPIYRITYERLAQGKPSGQPELIVYIKGGSCWITEAPILDGTAGFPQERTVLDTDSGSYTVFTKLDAGTTIGSRDFTAIGNQKLERIAGEHRNISGYDCNLAKTVINSNHIDIWYANPGVKGGPSLLGASLGMVLEIARNGDYVTRARKVEKVHTVPKSLEQVPAAQLYDMLTYRDRVWKSRFVAVPLFRKDQLNFDPKGSTPDNAIRLCDGMTLIRKVRVPEIKPGHQVFVDVTQRSLGDAYDRTGVLFVIPTPDPAATWKALATDPASAKDIQPLELMHFITPFGIGQYNHLEQKGKTWQDSTLYRAEITDLVPALSGREILVGMTIGNYDKGGHQVSANLTVHNADGAEVPGNDLALPLFNTNPLASGSRDFNAELQSPDGMKTTFTLDKPLKQVRLRYISTGHGGWENGDEFLRKTNTLFLDGRQVFAFTPWRTDCGSYRLSNPASGNFENGLSSCDYSRSNWCPGTMTDPIWIDLGELPAGEHTITVAIPVGKPEGGSSSSWSLSGVLEGMEN